MSSIDHPNVASFAVATALAGMLATPAVTEAATIGYWRFEGASEVTPGANNDWLDDYSGNGHDLTAQTNAGTQIALPAVGAGAEFPGVIPQSGASNQSAVYRTSTSQVKLSAPDTDDAFNVGKKFSIEAYFNFSGISGSFAVIAGQFHSSGVNERSWQMAVNSDGNLELMLSANGIAADRSVESTVTFAANTDYYAAFTVDLDGNIDLYYQQLSGTPGELIHAQTFASPVASVFNTDKELTIGSLGHGAFAFTGVIDEVRLSSGKLDRSELLAVVPEPASLSILSIAGLSLLARRRKH